MLERYEPRLDPRLQPYVAAVRGYRFDGFPAGVHVGLPGPFLTLIVSFDGPTVVADPGHGPVGLASSASGIFDGPAAVHHDGAMHGLQVDLTPRGARALLGVPTAELSRSVPLTDLLLPRDRGLEEELEATAGWPARTERLLRALTRRLVAGEAPSGREPALHAWELIAATAGRPTVRDVARELGWSERHLGVMLRAEVGLGTKRLLSVARFDRARRLVQAGRPLVEVAATCGYADQAHLTREWRSLAGAAPTAWLAQDALAATWTD